MTDMTKQFLTCQLPGCTTVIAVSPDEPTPRKYCCAEHRVAARRLRHEVLAGNDLPDQIPRTAAPIAATPKPAPRPRPTPATPANSAVIGERARHGIELGRRGAQRGVELGRHSAQRGVELGRHGARRGMELGRHGARRGMELGRHGARRGMELGRHSAQRGVELGRHGARRGMELGRHGARRGAELGRVSARRGAELSRVGAAALLAGCRHCRARLTHWLVEVRTAWLEATPRQRHATMLTGFVAVMLTGSGWIAVLVTSSETAPAQVAAPPMNSVIAQKNMAAWAKQASIDLTAVQNQLTEAGRGEAAWNAVPDSAKTGDLATSYTQLERQKTVLQQEQTMLQAGLNAVTNVHQTGTMLDDVERQLHSVSTMIDGMPTPDQHDIDETAIHGQLLQQQEVLRQECDMLHQELTGWVAAVNAAIATGLPNLTDTTTGTVNVILAASQQTPPAPPAPAPAPIVVLADGPAARPRHVVTSGAPPRHHGSSSSSSRGGAPTISVPGIGDLGSLEQLGFGIVHNVIG